jgi:hypothetical protein
MNASKTLVLSPTVLIVTADRKILTIERRSAPPGAHHIGGHVDPELDEYKVVARQPLRENSYGISGGCW